jgi:UDP-N-acetylglucosamine transferase subunit ALG13
MSGWHLLLQTPRVMRVMSDEYRMLNKLIMQRGYTAVISDNRFGIRSDKVPSVCITHQLNLQTPPGFGAPASFNRSMLARFSEVWIPDVPGNTNLSGELSHGGKGAKIPQRFIGKLSRFAAAADQKKQHILALISGPEPQRTIFERLVVTQLKKLGEPAVLVRGLPGQNQEAITDKNITVFNHLPTELLQTYMQQAKFIISRSGYSTLCDAAAVNCKVLAVPAPGQTEQEYLALYLTSTNRIAAQHQKEIDFAAAIADLEKIEPLHVSGSEHLLHTAIDTLLQKTVL